MEYLMFLAIHVLVFFPHQCPRSCLSGEDAVLQWNHLVAINNVGCLRIEIHQLTYFKTLQHGTAFFRRVQMILMIVSFMYIHHEIHLCIIFN